MQQRGYTVLRSVMTRTIHPVPAISVNYPTDSAHATYEGNGDDPHLFVPPEQHAPADVAPTGHTHPLVDVFHQRVVFVLGERSQHGGDVCRFGAVEDGDDDLECEVLSGRGSSESGLGKGNRDERTLASSTLGPYGGLSSTTLSAPVISLLR